MMPAITPFSIESAPSSGLTVRSSTTVIFTGSAPERSEMASALALATEKLPEICALPPRIGSLIDGADSTCPSSTIAKRLPTFCDVTRRSEEHTSELQSLMRISYAVFCLKKKKQPQSHATSDDIQHNNTHSNT